MSDDPTLFQRLAFRVLERMPSGSQERVLLITSARNGEGKSFIAAALAEALRLQTSASVALVGCAPTGPERLGDARALSWSDMVANGSVDPARFGGFLPRSGGNSDHSSGGRVTCLPYGTGDAATSFRAGSITRVVEALRKAFEFVILDGPVLPQCGVLMNCADAGLLVINASQTRREIIKGALQSDPLVARKLMGAVLNRRPQPVPDWLYRRAL